MMKNYSNLLGLATITLLALVTTPLQADFSYMECLKSDFQTTTSHEVAPFGLTKNILKIAKQGCTITINHERYKYLKKKWKIDVCRNPVHVKEGVGAVTVIKRSGSCQHPAHRRGDFCEVMATINNWLQDDGLIFAPGDRELLSSDHGKIYCTTLLLTKYLAYGTMLSMNKDDSFAPPPPPPAPEVLPRSQQAVRPAVQAKMVIPSNNSIAPKMDHSPMEMGNQQPVEALPAIEKNEASQPTPSTVRAAQLPPPEQSDQTQLNLGSDTPEGEALESF